MAETAEGVMQGSVTCLPLKRKVGKQKRRTEREAGCPWEGDFYLEINETNGSAILSAL